MRVLQAGRSHKKTGPIQMDRSKLPKHMLPAIINTPPTLNMAVLSNRCPAQPCYANRRGTVHAVATPRKKGNIANVGAITHVFSIQRREERLPEVFLFRSQQRASNLRFLLDFGN